MNDRARATFRAFATTVAPETAALDAAGWTALEAVVDRALAMRPPKMRRQVGLLLAVIERLPVLRYGRGFQALDPGRRTAFLAMLEHAPAILVRRGVWGLRTLVFMGYYTRPETMAEVGYRAHAGGWARRAGT
ncbi:MAG TPA: gluconate 2-dehydrogenase subunit 3 family protein [Longimicrobiales bacterium]|nr:gluconate 2-dehydrogenase subunit 3 family protein [Longimicrobiales bacterium]